MKHSLGVVAFWLAGAAALSAAPGITSLTVDGNVASAEIALTGGFAAELRLEFEAATGLSATSLGLSASLVNPGGVAMLARLPSGAGSVPAAFPVMIRIDPPSEGGLAFDNTVTLEIHTENLEYVTGTPLRLFAAATGGTFSDITESVSSGSYRARGSRGSFSEFVIVTDLRTTADVVETKLDAVDAAIARYTSALPAGTAAELASLAAAVRAGVAAGDRDGALVDLDDWLEFVESEAGVGIANHWRALRDGTNIAGELLALGRTLRFSVALLPAGAG